MLSAIAILGREEPSDEARLVTEKIAMDAAF